jgi:hypothetical protein
MYSLKKWTVLVNDFRNYTIFDSPTTRSQCKFHNYNYRYSNTLFTKYADHVFYTFQACYCFQNFFQILKMGENVIVITITFINFLELKATHLVSDLSKRSRLLKQTRETNLKEVKLTQKKRKLKN